MKLFHPLVTVQKIFLNAKICMGSATSYSTFIHLCRPGDTFVFAGEREMYFANEIALILNIAETERLENQGYRSDGN